MKLKKLVSLALAGVLAVSMLAGCKANGSSSSSSEQTTAGVDAAKVVAALDKKAIGDVEFTASASLQTLVDKALSVTKAGAAGVDVALLHKMDSKIGTAVLPETGKDKTSAGTDKVDQNYTFVVSSKNLIGASVEATVKELAANIQKQNVYTGDKGYTDLPAASFKLGADKDQYTYEYKYTADVAVISGANEQGQVIYYAFVSLTRTPTRKAA